MKKIFAFAFLSFALFSCDTNTTDSLTGDNTSDIEHSENEIENTLTPEEIKDYIELGSKYASTTKQELGRNLLANLHEGGALQALSFCNINAIPLTDSMATLHSAEIKRVTDLPRNPNNAANALELEQIKHFQALIAEGYKLPEIDPVIIEDGQYIQFFKPILTNEMCLQCHGTVDETVKPETMSQILKFYPEDKATGYDVDQVRGIFSIRFPK